MSKETISKLVGLSVNSIRLILKKVQNLEKDNPGDYMKQLLVKADNESHVKMAITEMVESGKDLINVHHVKQKLETEQSINLTTDQLRKVMTKDMNLVYRKVSSME